jgi:hypothetical protein
MARARSLVDRVAVDCMLTRAGGWEMLLMEILMACERDVIGAWRLIWRDLCNG